MGDEAMNLDRALALILIGSYIAAAVIWVLT